MKANSKVKGRKPLTQDLLREYFEYSDGHLWWIKPTNRRIKICQQFGTNNLGYRVGWLKGKGYKEYANYG